MNSSPCIGNITFAQKLTPMRTDLSTYDNSWYQPGPRFKCIEVAT